jgi:sulfite reductase alpha subunit-like flavoprotein
LTQAKEVFESILVLDDTDPNTCSRNEKRVIELTLSLPDDYTLEYQPGDSIGILVPNTSFNISFILHMLKQHHNIHSTQLISIDSNQPISLEEAMRYHFDISSTIQNEMICFILAQHANDPMEKAALILLASNTQEGKSMYQRYVEEQRRSIVDLLHDFPSCRHISLSTFISLLPLAVPRYYSVCSSPLGGIMDDKVSGMTSQKLTIAFSVVDYIIPPTNTDITCTDKARRIGGVATRYLETICSPFLSQMYPHGTTDSGSPTWLSTIPKVKIFPRPTSEFLLPSDWSTPLILIGPGTGIAPFMGFLAHRRAQLLSSSTSEATVGTWRGDYEVEEEELISESNSADYFRQKLGDIDVFFGCRFQDHDWLYKEEMHQLQKEGIISKLNVCFSREKNGSRSNDEIKYVQDFLKAKSDCSKRLVRLMEQKGMIFICGDGNKMAKDVQNAIINVFAQEMFSDGLSVELTTEAVSQAKVFVDMLKAEGRFVMDIWS